jgi:hypothetical protein
MPWKYNDQATNGEHQTFEIPKPPADPFRSTVTSWPKSTFAPNPTQDVYPVQDPFTHPSTPAQKPEQE